MRGSSIVLIIGFALLLRPGRAAEHADAMGSSNLAKRDDWLERYLAERCSVTYTVTCTTNGAFLNGPFRIFNTNGIKVAEGVYSEGKWNGELNLFHDNGRPSSRQFYEHGKSQGTEVYWNDSGTMIRTTQYVNGEKHGWEIYWAVDGSMSSRIKWVSGRPSLVEIFEEGRLQKRLSGKEALEYFREKALKATKALSQ